MKIHQDGKLAAIIAHLFFLGPIVAFFINDEQKDPFGSFYIRQNVGITIIFLLIGALMGFVQYASAMYAFYLFIFIIWQLATNTIYYLLLVLFFRKRLAENNQLCQNCII